MKPSPFPEAVAPDQTTRAGLQIDAAACLPFHLRAGGCGLCAGTCAHGAITVGEKGPHVGDACTGCGRCVPVCPMGAIEAPAFRSLSAPASHSVQQRAAPIRVECRRVPVSRLADGGVQVPCLGGLKPEWLITANGVIGDGPVLIDRGLCSGCTDFNVEGFAGEDPLDRTRDLLESMGVVPGRLPRRVEEGLSADEREIGVSPATPGESLSRRSFLGRLGRRAGQQFLGVAQTEPESLPADLAPGHPAQPSRARLGLLAACIDLARGQSLPMPFGLFRAARVESTCCDRGLCTAICPTGALRREATRNADHETVALRFSALDCIDCGLCVKTCPEEALALDERMDEGWREVETLKRFAQRDCSECGRAFTAVDTETTCQPCARSRDLVRDVFRQLYPAFTAAQPESPHNPPHNPNAAAIAHADRTCSEEE